MLAEKMGLEGFQYKYLSLFDYVGGAGIFSFISATINIFLPFKFNIVKLNYIL